jgi:hypothetical protein
VILADFRALVERLQKDIPAEFENGVIDIAVSPKIVPHPVHPDIYTLGECIPLDWSGNGADLQSRVVLYYGSFRTLAGQHSGFDWQKEAWETLTHELRHHIEWRANVGALEAFDWAAEQNFARHEGRSFDPAFYRSGEKVSKGVFKIDDDVFIEGEDDQLVWHGRRYRVPATSAPAPAFLVLEGLSDPPPGEAILVHPGKPKLSDLWRPQTVTEQVVQVERIDG